MINIDRRMADFDNLLNDMAQSVYNALDNAFIALNERNKDKALSVMENDEKINEYEAQIHTHAIEILTLMQPLAKDLRLLIGGIRIANDLERIGDYAKSIARFVIKVPPLSDSIMEGVNQLKDLLMANLRSIIELLHKSDVKKAYEIALKDDDLDVAFKSLLLRVVEDQETLSRNIIEISGMLRNIERAGDHATNICEIIIYIENGEFIDFG